MKAEYHFIQAGLFPRDLQNLTKKASKSQIQSIATNNSYRKGLGSAN